MNDIDRIREETQAIMQYVFDLEDKLKAKDKELDKNLMLNNVLDRIQTLEDSMGQMVTILLEWQDKQK